MTKIKIEMLNALAAYSGQVTRCPPGKRAARSRIKEKIAPSNGLMGIATMCRCVMKKPSVGGGAWRALSEPGSQCGTPQCGSVTV